eukprot:jgi/Mesen1/3902/ME000208S02910
MTRWSVSPTAARFAASPLLPPVCSLAGASRLAHTWRSERALAATCCWSPACAEDDLLLCCSSRRPLAAAAQQMTRTPGTMLAASAARVSTMSTWRRLGGRPATEEAACQLAAHKRTPSRGCWARFREFWRRAASQQVARGRRRPGSRRASGGSGASPWTTAWPRSSGGACACAWTLGLGLGLLLCCCPALLSFGLSSAPTSLQPGPCRASCLSLVSPR